MYIEPYTEQSSIEWNYGPPVVTFGYQDKLDLDWLINRSIAVNRNGILKLSDLSNQTPAECPHPARLSPLSKPKPPLA